MDVEVCLQASCRIYKTLFAFHQRSPENEVALPSPWLHQTIWYFEAQCFYVFIFTPEDGATKHRKMSS
jgi:hypothetical protein